MLIWVLNGKAPKRQGEIMNLFDAVFADDSEPEVPELNEVQQAAFDRDADVELCVHGTGNDSEPEVPELNEVQQAAFDRDADVELCVHGTGIKLGTGPHGETVLIIRVVGHTRDQETEEDKDYKIATDFAMTVDDAIVFLDNIATGVEAAMKRESPLAAFLAALVEAQMAEENSKLN
jgi:hypothetical protein